MSKFTAIKYLDDGSPDPATLPAYGVRVLACTRRPAPMDTAALHRAFEKMGIGKIVFGVNNAAGEFILTGKPLPAEVLKNLKADGHEQEYTRSALVEMYRIDANDKEQGQHLGVGNWCCDAMPLVGEFDLLPTHWAPLPELELGE